MGVPVSLMEMKRETRRMYKLGCVNMIIVVAQQRFVVENRYRKDLSEIKALLSRPGALQQKPQQPPRIDIKGVVTHEFGILCFAVYMILGFFVTR